MIEFTPPEKRLLQQIGRTEIGQDLASLLQRVKAHYSSIAGIDTAKGDAAAQVEGRRIFAELIDALTETIQTKERQIRPKPQDDFT